MKKALMKVILTAMTLITLLTVIPLSANAASNNNNNKTQVFSYLTKELGFNSAAACGIMANIEKESNFKPGTVIRDSNGLLSGGLCMWNGSRLNSLKRYCSKNGYNYLSIKGQLSFLEHELKQSSYKHIYNYLKSVSNSSRGAYDAAYYWCYYFEVPANRASKAAQRGNTASRSYWNTYGKKTIDKPELSFSKDKTAYGLDSSLTLKWTSGGYNADVYKVYVAEKSKKTGKYDWENSKIYTTTALKQKIRTGYLGEGSYSVFVKALNEATQNYKNSNYLTFTIGCLEHEYKTTVTKQPTLTKTGSATLKCSICEYKTTKKLDKINFETIGDYKMTAPTSAADSSDATSITLKWNEYKGAEGYIVYLRQGGKWVKVGTTDKTEFKLENLTAATECKFALKAYITHEDKIYATGFSKSYTTSTATESIKLLYVVSKDAGEAKLRWIKDEGATGYIVYTSNDAENWTKESTIRDNETSSVTLKDLEAGKTYYFKVRSYIKSKNFDTVYGVESNKLSIEIKD